MHEGVVLGFEWAPGLNRCPWAVLTAEVWECVRWWREWRELGVLPYGGSDLMAQPHYVYQAIRLCEQTSRACEFAANQKHLDELKGRVSGNGP